MSVGLTYDLSVIDRLRDRIDALADVDRRQLLEVVGATVESQTRRRIEEDKAAPDGSAWQEWSSRYKDSRHGGHKLLEGEGDLLDSINYVVSDDQVEVGSNLVYAGIHQFGSSDPVKVPAHQRRIKQAFGRVLSFPVWANVGPYSFSQNIPERPYLGTSADDEAELEAVVDDFLREVLP
ncbi:MAG: hypothetical protein VR64_24000 [Desulfatitalea sp. BRH_c12]|nr:MAG: hypothetical protein VR64_24000 [Desulfatitalea sp. BRH_c12]